MIIAFQVVLLIFMVISFICSAGEKTNKDVRNSYLAFFAASIIGFIATMILL